MANLITHGHVVIKRKFLRFLDEVLAHQTRRALAGLMFQELFSGETSTAPEGSFNALGAWPTRIALGRAARPGKRQPRRIADRDRYKRHPNTGSLRVVRDNNDCVG
jgi:hypothetical protein